MPRPRPARSVWLPAAGGARCRIDHGGPVDRRIERNDGYVAPAPNNTRVYDRGGTRQPYRDPRIEQSQESATPYGRGRATPSLPNREYDTGSRQILPRQTREPYDPVFERHVDETPQVRSQPQFESRSREVYRGRDLQQRPAYQPSMPSERSLPRTFERSEPTYPRSEPRSMPTYERSEPRAAPTYERSEPRAQPRYERPAPSFSPPSPPSGGFDSGRGSSSSSDGGGRSSRGQLERIIRDDD